MQLFLGLTGLGSLIYLTKPLAFRDVHVAIPVCFENMENRG